MFSKRAACLRNGGVKMWYADVQKPGTSKSGPLARTSEIDSATVRAAAGAKRDRKRAP
ncbi:MAG: hypothetical protein M3Z31_01140 [Pseudomonadota bacterium]|nr:hypothetical protein [Pseudomonadota bacterium]